MMTNHEDPGGLFPQHFWDFLEEDASGSCSRAEQQEAESLARLEGEFADTHEMDDLGPARIFASPSSGLTETAAAEPGNRSGKPKEDFTTAGFSHLEPSTQQPPIPSWLPQALPSPRQEVSQDFISNTTSQSGVQQSSFNEDAQPGFSKESEASTIRHIQPYQTRPTSWAQDISIQQQQQSCSVSCSGNSLLPPSHRQNLPTFPTHGTAGSSAGQRFPVSHQGHFASGAPEIQYTSSYAPLLAADPSQQQQQQQKQQQQKPREEEQQQQQQLAALVSLQLLSAQLYQVAPIASSSIAAAAAAVLQAGVAAGQFTGRPPLLLAMLCDQESLSPYQCLIRQHIQFFEAQYIDVESNAQGRNKQIVLGQVGIQCRFCSLLPPKQRARGAVYYLTQLQGIYQAAQNMGAIHLCKNCKCLPSALKEHLVALREHRSSAGGGKKYWADSARAVGVYETSEAGLRFLPVNGGPNLIHQEVSMKSVQN